MDQIGVAQAESFRMEAEAVATTRRCALASPDRGQDGHSLRTRLDAHAAAA
ncbi:hypothetical protein [Cupriavidus sp. IDO]|uniref:hypothetical protein n=1 Tax=Cupriavidus sp. IDO TaxID=1539142 RepID=UPI00187C73D6|nr:hypothetical protein [Cupriavidus sp. IDO]